MPSDGKEGTVEQDIRQREFANGIQRLLRDRARGEHSPTASLPAAFLDRLIRLAAFQNPEFYSAQAMRLSTFGKPRIIACAEEFADHVALPRGLLQELLDLFQSNDIAADVSDQRFGGVPIEAHFNGELRPLPTQAAKALGTFDDGMKDQTVMIEPKKLVQEITRLIENGAPAQAAHQTLRCV
jgi:hypothetical protein